MYKAIVHRYGTRQVHEFESKSEAFEFGEYGSDAGEHYFECVIDENDIIIEDNKPDVIGRDYKSGVGNKYYVK